MARNKYPEETIRLILDAAAALFMEKGYEKTSLQDIINATKLSKGAIYHHFASKEEIFVQICERIGRQNEKELGVIRDNPHLSGKEKLQEIFRASLLHDNQERILRIVPCLVDNPKFLAMEIRNLYMEVVPDYIQPILEEGIADGSIHTEHPKELAEALMMLTDIWLNPLLQPTTPEEVKARCAVLNQITKGFGVELLDDVLTDALVGYTRLLFEKHVSQNTGE